jgi:hypothetical protein
MRRELVCERVLFVILLNNLRYIFIVWRLSIVSKSDSNNPYHIWAELYFLNLNYLSYPVPRNRNEASIRVPRMFKSHAWQQYDKQMQCY